MLAGAVMMATQCAGADMLGANNINDYQALGYTTMGRLNTTLLYPAMTGKPYDPKLVLLRNRQEIPASYSKQFNDLESRDEFKAQDALDVFKPMLEARIADIKSARGFVVPLVVKLGEYDFTNGYFPLTIVMVTDDPRTKRSFNCGWEFSRAARLNMGACISAKNWSKSDGKFDKLALTKAAAQEFKQRYNKNQLGFYFVTEPTGSFQYVTDPKLRYGSEAFSVINVVGLQTVNVIEFIVVDTSSGDILIAGPVPGGAKRNQPPVVNGDQNSSPAAQSVGPAGGGLASARSPAAADAVAMVSLPPVKAGMPTDPAVNNLDRFLSRVSYAVYSDSAQVAEIESNLGTARQLVDAAQSDTKRDGLIAGKALSDATSKVDALGKKLEQSRAELKLKDSVVSDFGARQTHFPSIESFASAGGVYFDSYRYSDGRTVVVFRGTANQNDVMTDLQIGLTPELLAGLIARSRTASAQPVLSGIGDAAVNGMNGASDPNKEGLPQGFKTAEEVVARVIASGVRPSDIMLTGHSLGAGYAQYAGMEKHVGLVVGFNPAPLSAELQRDATNGMGNFTITMRHYVSYLLLNGQKSAGYYDPVSQLTSQYLKDPNMQSLKVLGTQYAIPVCASTNTPEYADFRKQAQGMITKSPFGAVASAFANKDLPVAWAMLNAHRMQLLDQAIQQGGTAVCAS